MLTHALMRLELETCNFKSSSGPRIDNSQSGCFKWAGISRCDREIAFRSRSGNVSISLANHLSGCATAGHQISVKLGGSDVKGKRPVSCFC